jgi:imidazolonepropionase-like amidohydrolase
VHRATALPPLVACLAILAVTGPRAEAAPPTPIQRALLQADSLPALDFVVEGVRLFDGREVHEQVDVVVRGGRIASIAPTGSAPTDDYASLPRVDGNGRTLLPLFVDAHVHTFEADVLEQALAFGVGVQLDMFADPGFLSALRDEQREGSASGRADVLGAGYLATVAGGHGTQYGMVVPTVDSAVVAGPWVGARAEEGADWVKIVLEPGTLFGMTRGTLDDATLQALVREAHANGLLAVVHVSLLDDALRAARAGADGLVHIWGDRVPYDAEVRELAESGLFVIPTLVVQEGMSPDAPDGWDATETLADSSALPHLAPFSREGLGQRFGLPQPLRWTVYDESIRRLHEAGVPLLTGSDAPNPGTTFGASVHRELELLTASGVPPVDALAGATSLAGTHFRLGERDGVSYPGVVAPDAPAHLLLVDGDPTTTVTDTRRIVAVWKEGVPFDRPAHAEGVAEAVDAAAALAAAGAPALPAFEGNTLPVGTFEGGNLASAVGLGWSSSTDAMAGGASTTVLEVVEGGAEGSTRALRVHGEVAPGLPFAWAGAFYQAGATPFSPIDASASDGIQLSLRIAEGERFQVSVFSQATGTIPVGQFLDAATLTGAAADDGWTRLTFRWEDFPGVEPDGFIALLVAAGPAAGPFDFLLDEVGFYRDGDRGPAPGQALLGR